MAVEPPCSRRLMVAFGTAAPDGSSTEPVMRPVSCAHRVKQPPKSNTVSARMNAIAPVYPRSLTEVARMRQAYTDEAVFPAVTPLLLPFVRKREHVQRIAVRRIVNVRIEDARHHARAAAAEAGGHGDVLLAAHAERHGEALDGRAQPRFPQHFAVADVHGAEHAVHIADE